jgi:hypothetical protein
MTDRSLSRLAWALCALTLLVLAASLALILLGFSTTQAEMPWRDQAISLVGVVGAPILGGLIASRQSRNPYGWLWLGFGLGLALQQLAASYGAYGRVVEPGTLVAPSGVSEVLSRGGPISLGLAPFLVLLFPTGRLPSHHWRPLAWIAALSGTITVVLDLFYNNADKVGGIVTATVVASVFVTFGAIVVSALSLAVRYHRARGVERQQLKWVAFAAVIVASILVVQQLTWLGALLKAFLLGGKPTAPGRSLENLFEVVSNVCLYTSVGIAILRHRLYDIDIIINRTLVYGTLTLSLALIYFVGVTATQALFQTLTGQPRLPQLAVVASTLAIAALFNPLRRRFQDFIDRRFYRSKYDAARTLEAFSSRLREETDLDSLDTELLSVVRATVQPEHVSLWVREPEQPG